MKALLIVILLSLSTPLLALEKCMSGSWYDQDNPGEGITIQVLDNQTLGYFYTYGSAGKAWYIMLGEDQNLQVIGTINQDGVISEYPVGDATVTPLDDNTISFSYDLRTDVDNGLAWCLSSFCEGDFIYTRLTKPIPCE